MLVPNSVKRAISYRALGAVLLGAAAVALSSLGQAVNRAPQPVAAPRGANAEPAQILKEMTEYLRNLQAFRVQAFSVDEVVTEAGTKIQLPTSSVITVARPNRIASEQLDDKNGLSFFYDGKSMALYCRADRTYAVAAAPPSLDATIDVIRKDYGIEAPGADLLYSRPYDVLMEQVKSGELVGHELVAGKMTRHLAFQGDEVDWQIWIAEGAEPLPLRFVITSKTMKGQPQFSVDFSRWEPQAKVDDAMFTFTAPTGAKLVAKMPTTCRPSP